MIGLWNNANAKIGFPFNSWGKGNGTSNQNVGNMPSHPNADYQNCVITNCGVGDGYVYNAGDAYFKGDGVNNFIQSQYDHAFSNASKIVLEAKVNFLADGSVNRSVFGFYDNSNNWMTFQIMTTRKLRLAFKIGGTTRQAISTDVLTDATEYSISAVKDGATLKLGINGVEVGGYDTQNTYNLGNKTFINKMQCAAWNSTNVWKSNIFWWMVYDNAITFARLLANHNLGKDMGLVGNNVGDVMNLTAPGSWSLLNKRNELAYNGAQLR